MIKEKNRNIQILQTINENPGVNFCDIMRLTGLKNGVLSYHINKLESRKKVQVKRRRGNTRFYPPNMPEYESILLEMLRRPTPREIILLICENSDGLTLNEIVEKLGKAQSTISSYLQILISDGILQIRFVERKKTFHIKKIYALEKVLQKYSTGYLSKSIENFRDIINSL